MILVSTATEYSFKQVVKMHYQATCVATTIWWAIYNKESHSRGRKQKIEAQKLQIHELTVNSHIAHSKTSTYKNSNSATMVWADSIFP